MPDNRFLKFQLQAYVISFKYSCEARIISPKNVKKYIDKNKNASMAEAKGTEKTVFKGRQNDNAC